MRLLLCIICFTLLHVSSALENNFRLKLLQVLFRHGDRTPDKEEVYKTDPYDWAYKKIGYGQLTKVGMQREFQIGEVLRRRYGDFLGEYYVDDVYARSTDVGRTKASLQLALAGLYPPSDEATWNENIPWLPIPAHYEPTSVDFLYKFIDCSGYMDMLQTFQDKAVESLNIDKYVVDHIRNSTGVTSPNFMVTLYDNIRSISSLGLPLPDWCSQDVLNILTEVNKIRYAVVTKTTEMARASAGPTIWQFLKNINNHEEGKGASKIYLYSGHDLNVGTFIRAHNFTNVPELFDYASTVVVEKLRGADDQIYMRMFLWTGVAEEWIPLKLENCDSECPISKYVELVEEILPWAGPEVCS